MNVRFLIKIPVGLERENPDGSIEIEEHKATLKVDTMLDPYFISESALLSMFMEEDEYCKYGQKAREIAYNSSLRAWEWTKFKLVNMPNEQKIHLVRELALCLAINSFAQFFHKGFQESVYRSKTYAEFTVTTSVKNSPVMLKDMIDNSKKCLDDIMAEIEELNNLENSLGRSNFKGACNPANSYSWRVWFNNNLPERSRAIYASEKVWYNGNVYKDGLNVSESRIDYNGRVARSPVYYY